MTGPLLRTVLAETLHDAHRYAPGVEQHRPTRVAGSGARRRAVLAKERVRDLVERAAQRAGFARRHFDPAASAARLARILELAEGLESTYAALGDERSRRRLADLMKLRVLGPYHAPLAITPEHYRAKQDQADRELLVRRETYEVSDPYFSPLSEYRVPVDGGGSVTLHSHSVDVVSVYLLHQYGYRAERESVVAEPGDVVLDVGGCWGDTALYFANAVGPHGKVYTFEFDPENLDIMRANLALNPELAPRIEVVERALWDRSGERLDFWRSGRMTSLMGAPAAAEHSVLTLSLDDFVAEAGLDRVDLVKMDVEGAEPKVLAGGRVALARLRPKLALAAYHRDDDLVELRAAVEAMGDGRRFYLDTFSPVEEETVLFATRPSDGAAHDREHGV